MLFGLCADCTHSSIPSSERNITIMAVTSKQIAELAGVSRGTVDRALHNRGRVSPEVAERIRKLAKELEYQPNAIGRALVKTSQDFKIGVVLPID